MGFVDNFLTPIFTGVVLLALVLWIFYIIYWFFSGIMPRLKVFFKYNIMRKTMSEKDIEWCLDLIDRKYRKETMKMELLKSGTKMDRIEELSYVFDKVKKLKGGI